jgi:RNase H-fold protein (predicted Holliday junction resolvase)
VRYLAIDHGQKRTGLAISDASETLVSPHAVIETSNQEELLRRILKVIDQEQDPGQKECASLLRVSKRKPIAR